MENTKKNNNECLFEALAKAQSEFKPVRFDCSATVRMKKGGEYTYKYASLDAVNQATREALNKNGLSLVLPLKAEGISLILCHSSGGFLESFLPINYKEWPDPQALGSRISYYQRYLIRTMLNLAAVEDDDGITAKEGAFQQPSAQLVTLKERKELMTAIDNSFQWTHDNVKDIMLEKWGLKSTKQLTKKYYDALMGYLMDRSYEDVANEILGGKQNLTEK